MEDAGPAPHTDVSIQKPSWECSQAKAWTDLLRDPGGTLGDRKRWPTRLCYPAMVEACRRWATENDPVHAGEYPLPLDDGRRAYLALRVRSRRSTLDLFALAGYKPPTVVAPDADDYLWLGGLRYILSGRDDTSLLYVISQAQEWWGHISIENIRGRPKGIGTYASRDEFMAAVAVTNEEIRASGASGRRITQMAVEERLGVYGGHGRQLRKWIKRYKVPWSELKKL